MQSYWFDEILAQLTFKQKKVLEAFLAGQTDREIARSLVVETSTIRRHITNICKAFGLTNNPGEHYSYREELIALFVRYQPEMVAFKLKEDPSLATLKFPDTPLKPGSPFYIFRPPIERRCQQEIAKPGAMIRIRGSQRTGKTSLVNLILHHARQGSDLLCSQAEPDRAISLNLRQAEKRVLSDLDLFLRWFALNIAHLLGIETQIEDSWDSQYFGSVASCTIYFQTQILAKTTSSVAIALDNLDWLFEFPEIARGFFPMLRSWHEEANSMQVWQKLKLIVAYSTEVYIPLDINQSPFNVGMPVKLPELTAKGILELAHKYHLDWSINETQKLMAMVSGHPYLVQLALYHLQNEDISLERLLQLAPTQAGIYNSILRQYWQTFQQHPELAEGFKTLLFSKTPVQLKPILAYKLESMGLIELQGNFLQISCQLYRQYFQSYL